MKPFGASTFLAAAPYIPGLDPAHQALVTKLVNQIQSKHVRNRLRRRYYDYKNTLRGLGIELAPNSPTGAVLGWPALAVDSVVWRTVLDTWIVPDGLTPAAIGIDEVYEDNNLDSELPAGFTSTLLHGVAFGAVSGGDTEAGEPEALFTIGSAESMSGVWDPRRRCLSSALAITEVDTSGHVVDATLYLPNLAIVMRRTGARWDVRQAKHDLGVPVEVLPYRPLLDRPFGKSRISRPVMELTDAAVRVLVRTDTSADFYNAPQRWVMGGSEDAFQNEDGSTTPGWLLRLGAFLALTKDEDGTLPQVGQFDQQSMTPNVEHMGMLARTFAAEASLPLRDVGVMGENPESAESQQMAERKMELSVRNWQRTALTRPLRRLMTLALRIKDDTTSARDVYRRMQPHWKRPDMISLGMAVDAVAKIDSMSPGFGSSEVGLEMAGLEPGQIERWQAEQRRKQARANIAALAGRVADQQQAEDAVEV